MDRLDQRRLEVLRAFAQHGTMTGAARQLYLSTSAVSQQLAVLEREVGVALLERHGRRVRLTEAGGVLAEHAEEIAAKTEAAAASMEQFRGGIRGEVHLSAFPSICGAVVPGVLAVLAKRYPALTVHVSDLEPHESVQALRSGSVDLAIIDDVNPLSLTGLDLVALGSDELVLCMPPATEIPPGAVSLSEFSEANWLLDGSQEVFDAYLHELSSAAGFSPTIVARCRNVSVTLSLVEAGVGVALLSRLHLRNESRRVIARSVAPAAIRSVLLATRASSRDSYLVETVRRELRSHVERTLSSALEGGG